MQGFTEFLHSYKERDYRVFKKGQGPGVLIMHELPGMVQECVDFASRLSEAGFTVYLPLLFGEPNIENNTGTTIQYFGKLCISKEFTLFQGNKTSPVIEFLKSLCRRIHKECGYNGLGAIGMCLTGGFVIPLLLEPALLAPVLSQPSLPINPFESASLACSDEDYEFACKRILKEKIPVLGFKFSHDALSSNEKFKRLKNDLGDLFIDNTIYSGPKNMQGLQVTDHAVFTIHFRNEEGHPTREAFDLLIEYYRKRLYKDKA
ncbi:MAG: dienelactone hydrolase family protein [Leptospiraceae bacterium]|nr:dienelactone hydrolase family protein [Leptospiraceae bacterium]MCP5499866.1 dienelactone hydrolase family protein [Leptospiraceae bacterium]